MKSANKSKILHSIYEENLHHVVRGERRKSSKQRGENRYIGISAVLYAVLVSLLIISLSNKGNVNLDQSSTAKVTSPHPQQSTPAENPSEKLKLEE